MLASNTLGFDAVAESLEMSLLRIRRRGRTKLLDVVQSSPAFFELTERHGFSRNIVLDSATACAVSRSEDGIDGLDWVLSSDGKRCLHVWLKEAIGDERPAKTARSPRPRPLPLLLKEAKALNEDVSTSTCFLVGEHVYRLELSSLQGVWLWFPLAQSEFIDDTFWEQLGYDKREHATFPAHEPHSWYSLIEPASLEHALACYRSSEATKGVVPYNVRVTYRRLDDVRIHLRCQGSAILWSKEGSILAILGSHTDITAENQDQLSKISFIGKISHEIRTPLNALCGSLDMLSDHMAHAPPAARESWDMLHSATQQVRAVVNDVLDFSSLSAGKLHLQRTAFSLHRLLLDVVGMHAANARTGKIALRVDAMPPDFPPRVFADRNRLGQVVSNVIANALKFTPEHGSVTVVVALVPHDKDHNSNSYHYTIDVVDTGRGVPRVSWETIFEDFEQARPTDAHVGTGLGLPICSMLIGLHGGRISVHDSVIGRGTTIRIQLETPKVLDEPEPDSKSVTKVDNRTKLAIGKVLIVDDMKTNRVVVSALVKRIDPTAEITLADDGQVAVNLVQEGQHFDFILMDVHMPILDGIGATRLIIEQDPKANVIGFTANTDGADGNLRTSCLQAGMRDVLLKPTTLKILIACLSKTLPAQPASAVAPEHGSEQPAPPAPAGVPGDREKEAPGEHTQTEP